MSPTYVRFCKLYVQIVSSTLPWHCKLSQICRFTCEISVRICCASFARLLRVCCAYFARLLCILRASFARQLRVCCASVAFVVARLLRMFVYSPKSGHSIPGAHHNVCSRTGQLDICNACDNQSTMALAESVWARPTCMLDGSCRYIFSTTR